MTAPLQRTLIIAAAVALLLAVTGWWRPLYLAAYWGVTVMAFGIFWLIVIGAVLWVLWRLLMRP